MKHKSSNFCPGCHKHCPAGSPKCKFGRTYFASEARKNEQSLPLPHPDSLPPRLFGLRMPDARHSFKWEKHLVTGGLGWKLLIVSRNLKKTLMKTNCTEKQIFDTLSSEEKETLCSILEKLNDALYR